MARARLLVIASVLSLGLMSKPASASDPDPWFSKDKALHFGVSTGIAAGTYALSTPFVDARGHSLLIGAGVTLAIGTGKELADMAGYGHPSWKDFAWDAIGCVAGLALAWSIDLLVRGVSNERPLFEQSRAALRF